MPRKRPHEILMRQIKGPRPKALHEIRRVAILPSGKKEGCLAFFLVPEEKTIRLPPYLDRDEVLIPPLFEELGRSELTRDALEKWLPERGKRAAQSLASAMKTAADNLKGAVEAAAADWARRQGRKTGT